MRFYLSARADDARGYDGRLRHEIARQQPGVSFVDDPRRADVVLVLIGPLWLREAPTVASRLLRHDDPIRRELEAAVERGQTLVPLLIRSAAWITAADVPSSLQPLLQLNAATISHQGFKDDVRALLSGLTRPDPATARAGARIELTTPNGTLSWILEKEYRQVRVIIDGEDRASMRMLNASKTFDVDAGAHTVTLRSTGVPAFEQSVQVQLSAGETARLRAARNGWLGTLTLERLS